MSQHISPESQHISPEEQLSAQFDSGAVSAETVANIGEDQAIRLLNQWKQLSSHLRTLPAEPATGLLETVRTQIAAERVCLLPAVQDAGTLRRKTVAFLACSVALLFIAVSVSVPFNVQNAGITGLADSGRNQNRQSTDTEHPEWGRIVVVSVPDDRYADVARVIRQTANDEGLSVQMFSDSSGSNARDPGRDQRMDIMVASEATTRQLLKALPARLNGKTDEELVLSEELVLKDGTISADQPTVRFWNQEDPAVATLESGIHDRRELLDMVAESMQSPTLSEQYFGEVFVVLSHDEALSIQVQSLVAKSGSGSVSSEPEDHAMAADQPAMADARVGMRSGPAALDFDSQQKENNLTRVFSSENGKPVLVVFQRRKPAPPASGSLWQRPVGQSIPTA